MIFIVKYFLIASSDLNDIFLIYLFTYLFIFTFIYLSIYLFSFNSNLSIYFYYLLLLLFSLETVSPQKLLYLRKRQNFYYIGTIENISSFS